MTYSALAIVDELTAAGLRLGGIETLVLDDAALDVEPELLTQALERARREAIFVILTAGFARRLPPSDRAAWLEDGAPLMAVIPDVEERALAPDVAGEVQRALGVSPT